jgi:hypothetical protein
MDLYSRKFWKVEEIYNQVLNRFGSAVAQKFVKLMNEWDQSNGTMKSFYSSNLLDMKVKEAIESVEQEKGYAKYHNSTGPDDRDFLFSEHVTGPQGVRYVLYRQKHHTNEDVKRAKAYLRANFDVVKIYVEKDW